MKILISSQSKNLMVIIKKGLHKAQIYQYKLEIFSVYPTFKYNYVWFNFLFLIIA